MRIEFTTDALIAWLRRQPPDQDYVWQDPVYCLMGHFLMDNGARWGDVIYSDMPGYEQIAQQKPHTFGAALERAEALKALPPPREIPIEPLPLLTVDSETHTI